MDNLTLEAILMECGSRWRGRRVERVHCPLPSVFYLRLQPDPSFHPAISVVPSFPGLFPASRIPRTVVLPGGRFPDLLQKTLGGSVLDAIDKEPADRVVRFRFADADWPEGRAGAFLVIELIGRSANLVLLREDRTIAGTARILKSEFRKLERGTPYREPPPPAAGPPAGSGWKDCLRHLESDRTPPEEVAASLRNLSPLLFGTDRDPGPGTPENRRRVDLLRRFSRREFSPRVLLPVPRSRLGAGILLDRNRLHLSPFPVPDQAGGVEERFPDMISAAEAVQELLFRNWSFQADLGAARRVVVRELERLRRLRKALQGDLQALPDPEACRRRGEALLAGASGAEAEAGRVRVSDPYSEAGDPIDIPLLDPARGLPENADLYFRKSRKSRRGKRILADRLKMVEAEERLRRELLEEVERVRDEEGLRALRTRLEEFGIVRAARKGRRTPAPKRDFRALRKVTSPDGWTIYIGRNARENHYLTFRVAAPRDFWLHAVGVSGSHVVVRNPSGRKDLPAATLRMAAGAAAYYSGARKAGEVEIHLAFRKDVRRGKQPGQVTMKRSRSLVARPVNPLEGNPP